MKDLTGHTFNSLKVLSHSHKKYGKHFWNIECLQCGRQKAMRGDLIQKSTACGCKTDLSLSTEERQLNRKYYDYIRSAARRGYEVTMTKEQFKHLISQPCEYCGTMDKIGVDRVDNTQGYVEGNIVSCCAICNRAKDVMTREEFLAWIKRVYNYSIK